MGMVVTVMQAASTAMGCDALPLQATRVWSVGEGPLRPCQHHLQGATQGLWASAELAWTFPSAL